MRQVITIELMGFINTLENITHAKVKDAFFDKHGTLVFIIQKGDIRKAIGNKGANVRRLAGLIKKRLKLVEYNEDVAKFVANCIHPLKAGISKEDSLIVLGSDDTTVKAKLIGRDKQNLEALKEIVNKYFKVDIVVK